jgi:hypothetical protein
VSADKTNDYILVIGDAGQLIVMNKATAVYLNIPADASVNFPVGTRIDLLQTGAGQVGVTGPTGPVTIRATPGTKLRTQYSGGTIVKLGTNLWSLVGDISA